MNCGIYKGLSDSAYNAIDAMRWSTLKTIIDSPLALLHAMAAPREDRDCFRFGRAFHAALLQPEEFAARHVVAPDEHTTKTGWSRKPAAQAWLADLDADALPVTSADLDRLAAMYERTATDVDACEWIRMCADDPDGGFEVVVVWIEVVDVDGVEVSIKCKAKADALSLRHGMLLDAKTHQERGRHMSLHGIEAKIGGLYYDAQLAFYARGFRDAFATDGLGVELFGRRRFIFAESVAPHDLACVELDDDAVQEGDHVAETTLQRYARALHTDKWPGCADGIEMVSLPRWRLPKNDDGSVADDLGLTGMEG